MKRWFSPFMLALTAIIGGGYAYTAWRLTAPGAGRVLLAVPFVLVWAVPVIYWVYERQNHGRADDLLHGASYLSMGWLTYVILLCVLRDALLVAGALGRRSAGQGGGPRRGHGLVGFACRAPRRRAGRHARAARAPNRRPDRRPAGGIRRADIVQISDLHVGPTIGEAYVRRVVEISNGLAPGPGRTDGRLVDGSVHDWPPRAPSRS